MMRDSVGPRRASRYGPKNQCVRSPFIRRGSGPFSVPRHFNTPPARRISIVGHMQTSQPRPGSSVGSSIPDIRNLPNLPGVPALQHSSTCRVVTVSSRLVSPSRAGNSVCTFHKSDPASLPSAPATQHPPQLPEEQVCSCMKRAFRPKTRNSASSIRRVLLLFPAQPRRNNPPDVRRRSGQPGILITAR